MPPTPPLNQKPENKAVGATFGIFIVLFLLIFGAFYFWGERINKIHSSQAPYIPAGTTTLPDITQ
jgi:CHASE3 domain sensor protein